MQGEDREQNGTVACPSLETLVGAKSPALQESEGTVGSLAWADQGQGRGLAFSGPLLPSLGHLYRPFAYCGGGGGG